MNQDLNNQNNNFNMQGNNGVPNNQNVNNIVQPLNSNVYQNQNFQQVSNNNQDLRPKKNNKMVLIIIGIIILLIIIVVVCFAFIKNDGNNNNNSSSNSNTDVNENPNNNNGVNNNQDNNSNDKELNNTIKISGTNVYISYSSKLRYKKQSNSILFYNNNDALVGITFNTTKYNGDLKDIINLLMDSFINDSATSSSGNIYNQKFTLLDTENVKINNNDSIKFSGLVENQGGWNCHIYGYALVVDDIPILFTGIVSSKEQSSDLIKEIEDRVDTMVKTIKSRE